MAQRFKVLVAILGIFILLVGGVQHKALASASDGGQSFKEKQEARHYTEAEKFNQFYHMLFNSQKGKKHPSYLNKHYKYNHKAKESKKHEVNYESKNETPIRPELNQPKEEPEKEQEKIEEHEARDEQTNQSSLHSFEQQVVQQTNKAREENGLAPLQIDEPLSVVARDKSKDMVENRYFSHNSPTYGSPFDMMRSYGIHYSAAGENIAMGQRSAEEVVNAWLNSPGHRANILNNQFTHIGVGYDERGNYWTQLFISK